LRDSVRFLSKNLKEAQRAITASFAEPQKISFLKKNLQEVVTTAGRNEIEISTRRYGLLPPYLPPLGDNTALS